MTLTGISIEPLAPGGPEWLTKMSASKVAAVLGLSPYDSRFSLWHRMNGSVDPDPQTDEQARGHYLEPAIAHWFQDQHPEWDVRPGGCWQHRDLDWYTASPDRLVHVSDTEIVGLELKTDAGDEEWGEPGTDQIPVNIRAQIMSQMDVVGTRRTYIAMLTSYLEFRQYVIDFAPTEAEFIRDESAEFLRTIKAGERPNIDEHTETYQTIRKLHPQIDGLDVDLDHELVRDYCLSRQALDAAKADAQYQTSRVADAVGSARRGRYLDQTIVTRQSRGDGNPYLVVGRSLPTFDLQGTSA